MSRDTGVAKLPGLPSVSTSDAGLNAWVSAVAERLEVREGARGNDAERVVTQRELSKLAAKLDGLTATPAETKGSTTGDVDSVAIQIGNLTATLAIKRFEDLIKATKLYQDLKKRLDDPSRFDDIREEVRSELLNDLMELARKQGAQVQRLEKLITDTKLSIAMQINTVTASTEQSAAGVRQLVYATTESGRAQAGQITQLEASLGNYYQDGTPGRAILEDQMTVTADKIAGLNSQWTLKVQAGKAIAGIGLAATEDGDGGASSAFIVAADKFAVVDPSTYSGGLTNTPDTAHIPFGIDSNGIYMNSNVYIKGAMRVDAGGKTLSDGMRGSMSLNASGTSWSDASARQAVWSALGNGGLASTNNHLVIGDMVTIGTTTKQWMGSSWQVPGVVINGNMLVDGTVAASKINTQGLIVRDGLGNPILGAGYQLPSYWVSGLGPMATASSAEIGSTVTYNGNVLKITDFVNSLSRINSSNISTFMEAAAIGNAYIGNAAVGTLQIAGGNVTSMSSGTANETINIPPGGSATLISTAVNKAAGGSGVAVVGMVVASPIDGDAGIGMRLKMGGSSMQYTAISLFNGRPMMAYVSAFDGTSTTGDQWYDLVAENLSSYRTISVTFSTIMATGAKR